MRKANKTKIIATGIATFVVFFTTLFATAENQNSNSLFLDSDQDGLTDQEEKMLGTDPLSPDTDGDGYSDGKEVSSGYNPLKPAPGDSLIPAAAAQTAAGSSAQPAQEKTGVDSSQQSSTGLSTESAGAELGSALPANLLSDLAGGSAISEETLNNLSSDPENPNLTNEMIGSLMQLTQEKAAGSEDFAENPSYTETDFEQITQSAFEQTDVAKNLPEISDGELKILPAINEDGLTPEEVKEKQKKEIEKYLASLAFVTVSNSPFSIESTSEIGTKVAAEKESFLSALTTGDTSKVDTYAQKARTGIDQMKQIEVPFVLKDVHKSSLQLAMYTLGLQDKIYLNAEDPMQSLAAASSLQAVAENALKIQSELMTVLNQYGIEFVNLPS
jgi:hypothetical protein